MTTRSHALRNTLFSSAGIYTEYTLGMFASIMIARDLGPQDYGVYGLFMWFVSVGIVITNAGITTGVIKFVAELRGSGRDELVVPLVTRLRRVQREHLLLAVGLAALLFFTFGHTAAVQLDHIQFGLLLLGLGMRAPYMFNIAIAKGFEAFDATAKVALVAAPLNLLMVIVVILLHGPILWFLVTYAISSLVFLTASGVQARRLLAPLERLATLPVELWQRVRRHIRIVSATVIIGFLIASDVEILFLTLFDSRTAAGYFKVSYQLATGIVLLVPGVFGALLLPMMSRALSQGIEVAGRRFVAATTYLAVLAVPVMTFGICFAAPVIALLYGASYAPAAPVFALIIFASGIGTMTQGASSLLVSADRQQTVLLLTLAFGVLKIVLDVTLIYRFGLHGAVAAIVTETLVSSAAYVTIGVRVGGVALEWRRLLRIAAAGAGAALVSLPVHALHWPPIWTLLAGGVLLSAAYLLLTLLLQCWNEDDIEQLQDLHQRLARGRLPLLGPLLHWAGRRAARESA